MVELGEKKKENIKLPFSLGGARMERKRTLGKEDIQYS